MPVELFARHFLKLSSLWKIRGGDRIGSIDIDWGPYLKVKVSKLLAPNGPPTAIPMKCKTIWPSQVKFIKLNPKLGAGSQEPGSESSEPFDLLQAKCLAN